MSVVLTIHSREACREVVLPDLHNEDYSLLIDRTEFALYDNLELLIEEKKGCWYLAPSPAYEVREGSGEWTEKEVRIRSGSSYTVRTAEHESLSILVQDKTAPFSAFRKYSLHEGMKIRIGRDQSSDICYYFVSQSRDLISKNMAVIHIEKDRALIEDVGRNGLYVNNRRVNKARELRFGDMIQIWGLLILWLGDVLAVREAARLRVNEDLLTPWTPSYPEPEEKAHPVKKEVYHRAPREMKSMEGEPVEIEGPPEPRNNPSRSLLMTIGPSMTMAIPMAAGSIMAIVSARMQGGTSSVFMFTGLVTAFLSAIIGSIWAIANMRQTKKEEKKAEEHRREAYSAYLRRKEAAVAAGCRQAAEILSERYPSASYCLSGELEARSMLWNRNASHEDFLYYRLGIGSMPVPLEIDVPKEKFTLVDDDLEPRPRAIRDKYRYLSDVPIGLDLLKNRIVGIIGGKNLEGAYPVVRVLAAQIASQNSYTDVKMAFLFREDSGGIQKSRWEFARWLPHTWSQDRRIRYAAGDRSEASDVLFSLASVLRARAEEAARPSRDTGIHKPYYIVFVEDEAMLESEPAAAFLLDPDQDLGVTLILMAETGEDLPNVCECIIQNDSCFSGIRNVRTGEHTRITMDMVRSDDLSRMARRLSNLEVKEIETGGEIPGSISFFDMYGAADLPDFHVSDRWMKNRTYISMKAMIGHMSGGAPCYLDVHEKYHGPHGLVAGTTGSGKSETLQTYILSLAVNFSPDDVCFFLIDYKGGGMANLFAGLPHLVGSVSNLSGSQISRAMVSIKSENRRRQRVFNENAVNNINAYTQLYKNGEVTEPVPHLFIIIDEFAELRREQPDFMKELISVAQVGRSLGVHLILATQKPAGNVDDNIWSNSRFHLCLRVQDRQDSMDMLKKPDAAYLTQAGRGYLQVGNDEIYQLFQSGWSGAVYEEDADAGRTLPATMLTATGKMALAGSVRQRKSREARRREWYALLLDLSRQALADLPEGALPEAEHVRAELTDSLYDRLRAADVEYPDSRYARSAMENFVILVSRMGADASAEDIQAEAMRKGVRLPERKEITQLEAVVRHVGDVALREKYRPVHMLWLPVLPERLFLPDLEGVDTVHEKGQGLRAAVGLYDDPANQLQAPFVIDLAEEGNYAVLGLGGSGRSTQLQTIAFGLIRSYTPEELNLYILDFSGGMLSALEEAPHVGGYLSDQCLDTVGKFFRMLERCLEERRKAFRTVNYQQYVRAHGLEFPRILVVIDDMASFREKTEEMYDEVLMQLLRTGRSYGISFAVSASGFGMDKGLTGRMRDCFQVTAALQMPGKYDYAEVLNVMHVSVLPEEGVIGRGLALIQGEVLEYQTALPLEAEDDIRKNERIASACREMAEKWEGAPARQVPRIPDKPVTADLLENPETKRLLADDRSLPFGYDEETADIAAIDLSRTYTWLALGRPRSGKTNLLRVLIRTAAARKGKIVVIETGNSELADLAGSVGAQYLTDYDSFGTWFRNDFIPMFVARNRAKKAMIARGLDEQEIYDEMRREEAVFVFIADLPAFTKLLHDPAHALDNYHGGLTNLLDKGYLHNIYFISAMDPGQRTELIGYSVFEKFIQMRRGIFLGGDIMSVTSMLQFAGARFDSRRDARTGQGFGYTASYDDVSFRSVVLPQDKKR